MSWLIYVLFDFPCGKVRLTSFIRADFKLYSLRTGSYSVEIEKPKVCIVRR